MLEICLRYTWDMPNLYLKYSICLRYDSHTTEICLTFAWDMSDIYLKYAWDMHEICLRYAWDRPEIRKRYDWDMSEICQRERFKDRWTLYVIFDKIFISCDTVTEWVSDRPGCRDAPHLKSRWWLFHGFFIFRS